jgi:diacylglycerol O-acyltransferase
MARTEPRLVENYRPGLELVTDSIASATAYRRAMTETLTALDATFLELEQLDDGALMGIGGVMVFDPSPGGGAPTVEAVCASVGARLGQLRRYSQRLSSTRTGKWAWPHWVDDERLDLRNHVRRAALPAPGSDSELCDWTAEFFSHPLDRARPLWEIVVVEGLEHNRWALGWKTHHCLVDGVGSVDLIGVLLDPEPNPDDSCEFSPPSYEGAPGLGLALPHASEQVSQAMRAGAHAAGAGLNAVIHPRATLRRSRSLAELIMRDEIVGAPRTSLNVPIGQARAFAVVRVPLAECKAIKQELGGSVNDVVLAACTSGLRQLLCERDEELPRRGLRSMVPVNVRDPSGRIELGNRVSSLFVDLPLAEADPRIRLQQITARTAELKSSGAADGAAAIVDLAALAPPALVHAALARTQYASRLFNVTITNVPGPQQPLYAFGAPLREIHPFAPLAAEHAVAIAAFSYNGLVTFGISADCESMPDLGVLAYGVEAGIEELLALLPESVELPQETRY